MEIELSERDQGIWFDAIKNWGPQHQMTMAIEESAEVIQALTHYERGRCGIEKVIEEFADAFVCVGQVIHDVHRDASPETQRVMEEAIRNSFSKLQRKLQMNDKNFGEGR